MKQLVEHQPQARHPTEPTTYDSGRGAGVAYSSVGIPRCRAKEGAADDPVSVNVVEWSLVAPITMKDVPAYEAAIPGVSAALAAWLQASTYDPPM